MKKQGTYDGFVATHNTFIMNDRDTSPRAGHRAPSFLPWHRQFLLEFERALQKVDASVSLPYWDWTADNSTSASLWADDFLGGDGQPGDGQVTTGPFAGSTGNWPIREGASDAPFLTRSLGTGVGALPTRTDLDAVLAIGVYDVAPWNSTSGDGFRNGLEGWARTGPELHNRVHVWIGGAMGTGYSPNDPVFWLHHCFIDRLWADWQSLHPAASYLPTSATTDVVSLNQPIRPWNTVTPADLLDHTRFYTYA
nr:tyrosinase family protein [Solihabitans fulvus]